MCIATADQDNRFAHDLSLIFHASNVMQRHAVNIGVSARVRSHPKAYAELQATIADGDSFKAMVEEAKRDPQSKAAEKLLKTVGRFLNLSASKVPWGPREQTAKMTFLMAMVRCSISISAAALSDPLGCTRIAHTRRSHLFFAASCQWSEQHLLLGSAR